MYGYLEHKSVRYNIWKFPGKVSGIILEVSDKQEDILYSIIAF